jgi:phosphatidylserine/phosphatidylglycerophosphate/cardiolipin synthase-like enzyme
MQMLKPIFEKFINKGIQVFVFTRDPLEHDTFMAEQSEEGIRYCEYIGVQVLLVRGGHHRKLAMIDRKILWEGSLNILSQSNSHEFMRRFVSIQIDMELFKFLNYSKFV